MVASSVRKASVALATFGAVCLLAATGSDAGCFAPRGCGGCARPYGCGGCFMPRGCGGCFMPRGCGGCAMPMGCGGCAMPMGCGGCAMPMGCAMPYGCAGIYGFPGASGPMPAEFGAYGFGESTFAAMHAVPPMPGDPHMIPPLVPPADEPPPGTLGRTYLVETKPIPDDKPPRVGMLEVLVPEEFAAEELAQDPRYKINLAVRDDAGHFGDLKGYKGTDDLWHFESEPLYPGIPQIYVVRAELIRVDRKLEVRYGREIETFVETKVKTLGYRKVRFIMGRIVELTF